MTINVFNIKYDLEGTVPPHQVKEVLDTLPKTMNIEVVTLPNDIEEFVSDTITSETGFCHKGFNYEIMTDEKLLACDIDDVLLDSLTFMRSLFMVGAVNESSAVYPKMNELKKKIDSIRLRLEKYK